MKRMAVEKSMMFRDAPAPGVAYSIKMSVL